MLNICCVMFLVSHVLPGWFSQNEERDTTGTSIPPGDDHNDVAAARVELGLMYFHLGTFPDIKILIDELIKNKKFSYLEDMLQKAMSMKDCPHWEMDFELDVIYGLATALFYQKKYVQAESHMQRLVKLQKQHLGNTDPLVGATLGNLGTTLYNIGKYHDAELAQREGLTIQKKGSGLKSLNVALTKCNLAATLIHLKKFAEADQLLKESIPAKQAAQGKLSVAVDLAHHGKVLLHQERYRKAEQVLQQALSLQEQKFGKDSPEIAVILNYIGSSLHMQEKYQEAVAMFQRAIELWNNVLRDDSPEMLNLRAALGSSLLHAGRNKEAKDTFLQLLPILKESLGEEHPLVSSMTCDLAGAYFGCGDDAEAESLWKSVLPHQEATLGKSHNEMGSLMYCIGDSLRSQNKLAEAIEWYKKSAEIFRTNANSEQSSAEALATALSSISSTYLQHESYNEAELACREELAVLGMALGAAHPATGRVRTSLAFIYERMGKKDAASDMYSQALRILMNNTKLDDGTDIGAIAKELGNRLLERGDHDGACQAFQKALDVARADHDVSSDAEADALADLGNAMCRKEDFLQAEKLCRRSLELRAAMFEKEHYIIAQTSVRLGGILCHLNK